MHKHKLLIIENDLDIRRELKELLNNRFSNVLIHTARSPNEAFNKAVKYNYSILLVDIKLGDNKMTGLEVLSEIRKTTQDVFSIVLTGYSSEYGFIAGKGGVDEFIEKPLTIDKQAKLFEIISNAIEKLPLKKSNKQTEKNQKHVKSICKKRDVVFISYSPMSLT